MDQSHKQFRIVLVEPEESLNIGSVARAMKNLGFADLHLVSPKNFSRERANITAVWADDLVGQVKEHDSLAAALGDMTDVVGFSGRAGKNRGTTLGLEEWLVELKNKPAGPVALVFGPEDHGLTAAHTEHCRKLVQIPASAEYSSYNLAQAVLLVLFEIRRGTWPFEESVATQPTWNDFYQLDRLVENVAQLSGFYRSGTPEPMPGLVKNLLRRMQPDAREMAILLGLFGRIEKTLKGDSPVYLPER